LARLTDVGVAGLHRLLPHVDALADADAVVVVAGMEGALASVVGGLTAAPVVAVPTSAGYGASLGGVTALLAMLASGAAGITVVGIDNGFGAACAVARACDQRPGGHDDHRLVPPVLRHRRRRRWRRCSTRCRSRRRLRRPRGAPAPDGITIEAVQRCGIGDRVVVPDEPDHHHRPYMRGAALLDAAQLPPGAAAGGGRVRTSGRRRGCDPRRGARRGRVPPGRLARRHRRRRRHVRRARGPRRGRVRSAPVGRTGTARSAHGILPNPAPAVVALLASASAPVQGVDIAMELTTPTGAACSPPSPPASVRCPP
jgi:hypothetical protein